MRRAIALAVAVAAVTIVTSVTAAAPAHDDGRASFVLVVNPSAKAIKAEIAHAQAVVGAISSLPSLWMIGIYEQRTSHDRPPFNAPFLATSTPQGLSRPRLAPLDQCSESSGTDFEKARCKQKHDTTKKANAAVLRKWNAQNAGTLATWRSQLSHRLSKLETPTEEAAGNAWDLRGTLSRIGNDLAFAPGGARCVALLGGLLVKNPPSSIDLSNLSGVTFIVAGWQSTASVKSKWTSLMKSAGASIEFVPADVTDIALVARASECAGVPA